MTDIYEHTPGMGLLSDTLQALPKVTQRNHVTSRDLEEDFLNLDFIPVDGAFVNVVLEIPRIKVARSKQALRGEAHHWVSSSWVRLGSILKVMGLSVEEESKPTGFPPRPHITYSHKNMEKPKSVSPGQGFKGYLYHERGD